VGGNTDVTSVGLRAWSRLEGNGSRVVKRAPGIASERRQARRVRGPGYSLCPRGTWIGWSVGRGVESFKGIWARYVRSRLYLLGARWVGVGHNVEALARRACARLATR
jgi:hypothetical protein